MSKVPQPLHISQAFGIKLKEQDLDFFDSNLYYDSLLFIDPFLIKRSPVEEESKLFDRFGIFFKEAYSKSMNAEHNHEAFEDLVGFFSFKEPKEINLGYTRKSNAGSGLGSEFANSLISFFLNSTAKRLITQDELYPQKKFNPLIFTIFADKLGPDGISDLTANLIMDYLIKYTQSQAKKLNIATKILPVRQTFDFEENEWTNGIQARLPENPLRPGEPIIFVPKRLLRGFGLENQNSAKSKLIGILTSDPILTKRFSELISKPVREISIGEIRKIILQENSILKKYFENLENSELESYDFNTDILAFLSIKRFQDFFSKFKFKKDQIKDCHELIEITQGLIEEFKSFMESTGWKDMWYKNKYKMPVHQREEVFGRMFRAMGVAYFSRYPEVTFLPEVDSGRGELDFGIFFSDCSITIELKNLCNSAQTGKEPPLPAYIHGLTIQLPIYTIGLKAKYAFYITGQHYREMLGKKPKNHDYRANELRSFVEKTQGEIKTRLPKFIKLFYLNIDLTPKLSASKANHI